MSEITPAPDAEVFGTVTVVYDHHVRTLPERLTELHDNCLEVVLIRGKSSQVSSLANRLIATKGVKHGRSTLTTSGRNLP